MPQSVRRKRQNTADAQSTRPDDASRSLEEAAPITKTRARVGRPVEGGSENDEALGRTRDTSALPTVFETQIREHFALHRKTSKVGNYAGFLSTTFAPEVFSAVFDESFSSLFGFHVAVRPTDLDGGTHLPQFLQAYVVQRASSQVLSTELKSRITSVIQGILSSIVPGFDGLDLEFKGYEWDAISTGYQGTAHEVNVRSLSINGQQVDIEGLEVAQYNHFQSAGGVDGQPTELIVFGIDRMHYFMELADRVRKGVYPETLQRHHSQLYPREISCDAMLDHFEWLGGRFGRREADTLVHELQAVEARLDSTRSSESGLCPAELRKIFLATSHLSTEMEVGYSGRAINSELRTFFTRRLSRVYNAFAKRLRSHRGDSAFFAEFAHFRTEGTANVLNASTFYIPPGNNRPEAQSDLLQLATQLISQVEPELAGGIVRQTKTLMLANLLRVDFSARPEIAKRRVQACLTPSGDWGSRLALYPQLADTLSFRVQPLNRLLEAIAVEDALLTGIVHPQLKGQLLAALLQQPGSPLAERWRACLELNADDRTTISNFFHHQVGRSGLVNRITGRAITDVASLLLITLKAIDGTIGIYQAGFVPTSSTDVFFARQKLKLAKRAADQLGLHKTERERVLDQLVEARSVGFPDADWQACSRFVGTRMAV